MFAGSLDDPEGARYTVSAAPRGCPPVPDPALLFGKGRDAIARFQRRAVGPPDVSLGRLVMRFAMMLLVLTSLAGCAQYDAAREANLAAAAQERVASDDANCRSSGGKPGDPQYDDCRKRLANEQARDTRGHQRLIDHMLNESSIRPIGQ